MSYKIGKSPHPKKTKRIEYSLNKDKVIGYEYSWYKRKSLGLESKITKIITNDTVFKVAKYDFCIIDHDEGMVKWGNYGDRQ